VVRQPEEMRQTGIRTNGMAMRWTLQRVKAPRPRLFFGVRVPPNASRECFGESQLPGRIVGSQGLDLVFQIREQVVGNFYLATIDVIDNKNLRACFLGVRAAGLAVEKTRGVPGTSYVIVTATMDELGSGDIIRNCDNHHG
jgi:hypothetical protein